ncbi:MAG: type II secretion system protein [Planctomycetota bacterium]|jgi:prepilin-type N-terminal cleavage/methylation domain-containing protein
MEPKGKKAGFTIVELLTVMSIIVILLSLLLPSLQIVRRHARVVGQKNQFRNIDSGLTLYESDFDEYPDSRAVDADGEPYCGAMKLGEVMAGQDGLGFHLDSKLLADDGTGQTELYPPTQATPYQPWYIENLRSRKEYLEIKDVDICSLTDLFASLTGTLPPDPNQVAMLCDVFKSVTNVKTGKRMGMPVLYYRANTSKLMHDLDDPDNLDNIYSYLDNHWFLDAGLPWNPAEDHPLWKTDAGQEGEEFYKLTQHKGVVPIERPHNKDSYILISAGWDGIYGTRDDVHNFND